jgi:endoglucanase
MLVQNFFAAAALAATAFAAPSEKRQNKKLKWFGINESGAEFGEKNFTGVYGKEFIWYDLNTIDVSAVYHPNQSSLGFLCL